MRRARALAWAVSALCACEVVAPLEAIRVVDAGGGAGADGNVGGDGGTGDARPEGAPSADAHPSVDAVGPAVDAAGGAVDGSAAVLDAAPTPDGPAPACRVDADCAPELCRAGQCVARVQFVEGFTRAGPPFLGDVVSLDANGDGTPDLAVVAPATGEVLLLVGVGDGTFVDGGTPTVVAVGQSTLAAGHFDDDLLEDVVVGNNDFGQLTVLHADGGTGFTTDAPVDTVALGGPTTVASMAVGDLTGDGLPDVVVANQSSAEVELYAGGRPAVDGAFLLAGTALFQLDGPDSVSVHDMSAGAGPSVVGLDATTGEAFVFSRQGPNYTAALSWSPADGPARQVTAADVDEDGVLDLVATVEPSNRTVIRLDGGGELSLAAGTTPLVSAALDLDGDTHRDALMVNTGDSTMGVNCGDGAGGFERDLRVFPTGGQPSRFVTADFDGDGREDVAVMNLDTPVLSVHLNRSPGPSP